MRSSAGYTEGVSQSTSPYSQPLPPEIYRRRRIAAGVGLVVVLVVLVLIVRAITGGGESGGSTAAQSSTAVATSQHTRSASATSGASSTKSAESSTQSSAASDAQCSLDDLQLAVRAGAPTYAEGQLPDFFLTVTNPTGSDCMVDLAQNPMKFEVFTLSDYTRVWGDTDCNDPAFVDKLALTPGETRSFALNGWSRTTSSPGDCGTRAPAGTGAFLLYGHIGDKTSEPETFNLA